MTAIGREFLNAFKDANSLVTSAAGLTDLVPYLGVYRRPLLGLVPSNTFNTFLYSLINTVESKDLAKASDSVVRQHALRAAVVGDSVGKLLRAHSISQTQLAITMYLVGSMCPLHCIDSLQSLGITCCPKVAQDALTSLVKNKAVVPLSEVYRGSIMIALDNLDILRRIKIINSERKTEMYNCVNWMELHLKQLPSAFDGNIVVTPSRTDAVEFARSLHLDPADENFLTTRTWNDALNYIYTNTIISAGSELVPASPRATFHIHPPIIKGDLIPHTNVEYGGNLGDAGSFRSIVWSLYFRYIEPGLCEILLISRDEQVFEVLWKIKISDPLM